MYIGNLPMPQGKRTVHQRLHPLKILGKHAGTAGISMVNGHARQVRRGQFLNLGRVKIHAGQADAIHVPIAAMLQIGHGCTPNVVIDKGHIIAATLRFGLESLQNGGKKIMG